MALYLIPIPIAEERHQDTAPYVVSRALSLKYFIVEKLKTSRRFLKALDRSVDIDSLVFFELEKHGNNQSLYTFLASVPKNEDVGLMSEAGCPAVADPGHSAVAWCHLHGVKVVPMVGPSSIILALMASGFNGQSFAFHGYLPHNRGELSTYLKQLDAQLQRTNQTQLFIETPYRNGAMVQSCLDNLPGERRLCVAIDLDSPTEQVINLTMKEWKSYDLTSLHKRPALFVLGKF